MTSAWVLIIASVLHFGLRRSCFLNIEQLPLPADTLFARHIAYCAVLHFLYDLQLLPDRYRRRMGLLIGFLIELVLGVAFMELLGQWLWFRVEHTVHRCLLLGLRHYGDGLGAEMVQYLKKAVMRGVMTSLAGLLWLNAYAATEPQVQQQEPQESQEPQAAQVPQLPQVGTAKAKALSRHPKHRPLAKKNAAEQPVCRIKGQDQQDQKQKLQQKMKLMLKQKADRKLLLEQGRDKDKDKDKEQNPEQLPLPEEAEVMAPPEEQQQQQQQQHLAILATASDC